MTQEITITQLTSAQQHKRNDFVAVEEPLEIQLLLSKTNGNKMHPLSVTMRTPGQDAELAVGFLFTEGILSSQADLLTPPTYPLGDNKIIVRLSDNARFDPIKLKRNFYTTSSCGVCGKESIEAIHQVCQITLTGSDFQINSKVIFELPKRLGTYQTAFISTGGIHAAALFNTEGKLLSFREDVGRHNALDKLIGSELLQSANQKLDLRSRILLLSGRASFELIQKAAMAGIKAVCAIGAPSSLAIETAKSFEMTLVGFLKQDSANIYCGNKRITHSEFENQHA